MKHREERRFDITLHLSAEFDEDYEGDDDGFAWHQQWQQQVQQKVVAAVFDALRSSPDWEVVPAPRGRDPGSAVDIDIKRR